MATRSAGWIQDATSMTVLEEDPSRGRLVVEARRDGALLGAVTLNAASVHREYQRRLAAPTPVPSIGGDHATASGHRPL